MPPHYLAVGDDADWLRRRGVGGCKGQRMVGAGLGAEALQEGPQRRRRWHAVHNAAAVVQLQRDVDQRLRAYKRAREKCGRKRANQGGRVSWVS